MARRLDVSVMDKVVEVRRVQRLAAEMRAGEAAASLREIDRRRAQGLEALQEDQERWLQCFAGASLDLGSAGAWSTAVLTAEAQLNRIHAERIDAEAERARRADAWRGAITRSDVAKDLARTARNQRRRQREEAALEAVADRFARRSGSS